MQNMFITHQAHPFMYDLEFTLAPFLYVCFILLLLPYDKWGGEEEKRNNEILQLCVSLIKQRGWGRETKKQQQN